jgi:DNA-binding CsgD family transcriptional regulator/biotin operon repressor
MTPRTPALPSLPLVGRATELATLGAWLDDVGAGRGGTLIIAGAGGVGKTRLATTVAERAGQARRARFAVSVGRVYAVETGVPYAVFSDALLPLLRGLEPAALSVLTRGSGAWLSSICPAFAPDGASPADEATADAKARLFWTFTQFLGRLAARQPLLLVLDNMQWADTASLELLHFVGRQIGRERIGVLCTYNEAELEQNPALRATEQSLLALGAARLLRLEPLTHEETERLVCETFRTDASTTRRFVARLFSWTRGHPFFIEETLKALVESGGLHERDGRWMGWEVEALDLPRSVRAAVVTRMDRLAPPVRTLATVAAVVGTRVGHEVLRAVSGLPEAAVLEGVDELRRHGVLVESTADRGVRYEFSHPILAEVLYAEVGLARARLLHASVAEALETLYGDDALAHADLLAFHYSRADARGLEGKAVKYLAAAGRDALAKHADREAVAYLSAALDRTADAEAADAAGTGALVEDLARARQRAGEYDAAMALWSRAVTEAAARGEPERVARIERRIGLACYWSGRYEEALAHLDTGLAAAREVGDDIIVAQLQLARGSCFQSLGRPDDAAREVHAALAIAERAGDQSLRARVHRALLFLHTFMGPPDVARHHGEQAVRLAEELGDRNVAWSAHWGLAMLSGLTGSNAEIARHLAAGEQLADALHSPLLSLWTDEVSIELLSGEGDFDGALALAERAITMARALSQRTLLPRLLVWAGVIYVSRGDFERAKPCLDEAWELTVARAQRERPMDVHTHVPVHTGLTLYYLATGDHARAIEVGEAGLAIADRSGYVVWAIHRLLPAICEAALWRRDLERARRTAAKLREVSTRIGHRLGLIWSDAADGLIARLDGDLPTAAALLARSADELERVPWVYDSARLRRFLARVLIDMGDRDGATQELRRSHEVLVRLRAESELSHTREMLRELGARLPARTPSTGAGAGALTSRELDIARLVAARKSNKAIGEALEISPRTVSTHVSNMFAKLKVSSRGELADLVRAGTLHEA